VGALPPALPASDAWDAVHPVAMEDAIRALVAAPCAGRLAALAQAVRALAAAVLPRVALAPYTRDAVPSAA